MQQQVNQDLNTNPSFHTLVLSTCSELNRKQKLENEAQLASSPSRMSEVLYQGNGLL